MITLNKCQIQLQARSTDKQDAIRQAGQLLVESGCIDASYVQSMLSRESVANTYLGNGVAIPHGLPRDSDLIKQTGVAVLQMPDGTLWNSDETAHLIVGIAAKPDEYSEVFQRLTRLLGDKEQLERLSKTTDPRDIIEALTGERPAATVAGAEPSNLPGAEPEEAPANRDWSPQAAVMTIAGVCASRGLAVGPIRRYTQQAIVVEDHPGDATNEGNAFQKALDAAHNELDRLYEEVKPRLGSSNAAIFRVHAELLNDATLIQQTIVRICQGHSAAWSWQQTINERVSTIQKLDDPVLAGRAVDLSDVGQRVLRQLVGASTMKRAISYNEPIILVAEDLMPSAIAELDADTILGFCTARGGPTSHSTIIARSLGIPALVGAGDEVLHIPDGTPGILDGFSGKLYLKPHEADMQTARERRQQLQHQQDSARAMRFEPAITTDGYRVEVVANINRVAEARQAVEAGAEGVGLMRTEFLFLGRDAAPTEDEQFAEYRDMARALGDRPLVIRTLDIGGDKEVPYLNLPEDDNSFLGMRGIRLCLARPDLFLPQLRAIYRASVYGRIHIMFPMIATLEEFRQARALAEQVRQELNAPVVPIGIMIEVPSAVTLADHLAPEIDFFSIGINDLMQYTLAMDRLHPQLAKQADALHPAVLSMVEQTVQAANKAGKWVGVCGGIAGDPQGAALLAGLGVSELSVSIPNIAGVKARLRSLSLAEMQATAQKALLCNTAAEVRKLF